MAWKENKWVDDDGSLTVGTIFDAANMQNIEEGIAQAIKAAEAAQKKAEEASVLPAELPGLIGEMCDFVGFTAPTVTGAEYKITEGQSLSRTTYATLFGRVSLTTTGSRTSASKKITAIPSGTGALLKVGMPLEGTGIAAGTTIETVNSTTEITLSIAAESTGTLGALVFIPWGFASSTTFNLPDGRGRAVYQKDGATAIARLGADDGIVSNVGRKAKHTHEKGTIAASMGTPNESKSAASAAGNNLATNLHTHTITVSGATAEDGPAFLVTNRLIRVK